MGNLIISLLFKETISLCESHKVVRHVTDFQVLKADTRSVAYN